MTNFLVCRWEHCFKSEYPDELSVCPRAALFKDFREMCDCTEKYYEMTNILVVLNKTFFVNTKAKTNK